MASKELTESQLEAMSDEQREAWLTGDESAQPGSESESDEDDEEDDETPSGAEEGLQEQDDDEQQEESEETGYRGPGKPEVAVSKERNRRKKAERENAELAGQVQSLTNLVAQLMVQGGMTQQKAEAAAEQIVEDAEEVAPDIEEDPEGWAKHLEKRLMSQIETLKNENQELKQAKAIEQQAMTLQQMQEAFAQTRPDYFDIVNLDDANNPLTKFYAANPEVYERHMASDNPVEEAYFEGLAQHAKEAARQGKAFAPKAPVKAPAMSPKVKQKQVPPSLVTVGGTQERGEQDSFGDLTEEEVAALSPKQRARYLAGA